MNSKVNYILLAFFLLQLIASCCRSVRYYDYTEMELIVLDTQIDQDETLRIGLNPTDYELIGARWSELGFAQTFAISCDDGWDGMKYPFTNIQITSDADFDADHLAGESLTDYFQIEQLVGIGEFEFIVVQMVLESAPNGVSLDYGSFQLEQRPNLDLTHQFNIALTKSNGSEIVVETVPITWAE